RCPPTMCAQPSRKTGFGIGLKLAILAIVVAVAIVGIRRSLRPVALVAPVTKGIAVNSVPGNVLVIARVSPLLCEVGGRIQKTILEPGKTVKEGDVLVQIDTGDIDLDIEKINVDLDAAKKKLAAGSNYRFEVQTAEEDLETAQRNFERGGMS